MSEENNQLQKIENKQQEYKEFIQQYVDQLQDSQDKITEQDKQEMESVLYSVSYGRQEYQNKVAFQAFSAAISNQIHVDLVLNYICKKQKVRQAKCKVIAYRVNSKQKQEESQEEEQNQDLYLIEGYDDCDEEGCGQKLLHLLQKMGVENILIIVCIWNHRMPGQYSTQTYKMVLDRAKDLLTTLHMKVLEAEKFQQEIIQNQQIMLYNEDNEKKARTKAKTSMNSIKNSGIEITTKVYPSNVIPDQKGSSKQNKKNYRPNNFLCENGGYLNNQYQMMYQGIEKEEQDQLEIELTEDEFNYAVKMTEQTMRRLTKAHIIELRNQIKPHPLIEKVLNMICILRGCIAPNWTVAREMMNSMTFKMELMLMDVTQIKQSLIKRVIRILNNNQKLLTPDNLNLISEGASILLTWIINLIKWNAGCTKYKFDESVLAGNNLMNKALIAQEEINNDEEAQQEQLYDKTNAYGLMKLDQNKKQSNQISQNNSQGTSQMNKKNGSYLQSKQMIFSENQVLLPLNYDIRESGGNNSQLSQFQNFNSNQQQQELTLQNQLLKQYQVQSNDKQYEQQTSLQKQQIQQQINNMCLMLKNDQPLSTNQNDQIINQIMQNMPQNQEDILRFLNNTCIEEQPMEVLMELSQKLKERRDKLYTNDNIQND